MSRDPRVSVHLETRCIADRIPPWESLRYYSKGRPLSKTAALGSLGVVSRNVAVFTSDRESFSLTLLEYSCPSVRWLQLGKIRQPAMLIVKC